MGEHISHDKIHILTEYSQKDQWEKMLRYLWKTCFHDPTHYEDFYFGTIYPNNKVYAIQDKGMIHVNSYRCKVMNQEMVLPYIVGVATDEKYRRQGVMRSLLEQVLSDLHEQKVPFAYLMPANEEYYKPFDFRCVNKKSEYEVKRDTMECSESFQYLSYAEFQKLSTKTQTQLLAIVNQWLEQRYDVYTIHDKKYYDLLYAEKNCQSGDVVFCFKNVIDADHLCSVFAYAMDEEVPYVEQVIVRNYVSCPAETMSAVFCSFFDECDVVKVAESYPYMLRIVHRETFLELFGEKLSKLSDRVVDELTDAQLIETLFEEKDNIYFAEIV